MNRLIVLSLLLVLLTACKASLDKGRVSSAPMESSAVESNILIDKSSNKNESVDVNSVYGDYLSGSSIGWFSTIIKDHPIDMDYAKENNELQNSKDFNTSTWLELEKKYTKAWDDELNYIYKKLLVKLNSENKESLVEAQRGWLHKLPQRIE